MISPPSKAGPAGHDAAIMPWRSPTTTSVLVPTSTSMIVSSALVHPHGEQVRRNVGAYVAADERGTVYVRLGEYTQAQLRRTDVERGRRPKPVLHLQLGQRLVGLLADRLHVQPEQHVAHGRVADYHDVVDLPPVRTGAAADVAYLEVDRGQRDLPQLAGELPAVVGDAVHDVAAAEPLRVLEG